MQAHNSPVEVKVAKLSSRWRGRSPAQAEPGACLNPDAGSEHLLRLDWSGARANLVDSAIEAAETWPAISET